MKITSSANDNVTHHVGMYEQSHRRYCLTTQRRFTGVEAHDIKRNNRTVTVAEDTFEQWAWNRLTRRALVILNAHRYMASWTDEESGEVHEDAWTTIDTQDLAQRLLAAVWVEAGERIDNAADGYNQKHPNTITQEHVEDMVQRIAEHQRDLWDWQAMSDRGRKGGEESKRPEVITARMVMALPFLNHTSADAQRAAALVLHCTKRTVEKRLKKLREEPSVIPAIGTGKSAYRSQKPKKEKARAYRSQPLFTVDELSTLPLQFSGADWSYLLEIPETPAPMDVEQTMTDMDQPDVFDRFYADFHAWQADWQERAHGPIDLTADLESVLDDLL